MTPERFYRRSLLLPIIVPAVTTPLAFVIPDAEHYSLVPFLFIPVYALLIGGLPYAALALLTLYRIEGRPAPEQWTEIKRLPLVNALVLFVLSALLIGFASWNRSGAAAFVDAAKVGAILAGFATGLGYLYVLLAALLFHLLRARGLIRSADPETQ